MTTLNIIVTIVAAILGSMLGSILGIKSATWWVDRKYRIKIKKR